MDSNSDCESGIVSYTDSEAFSSRIHSVQLKIFNFLEYFFLKNPFFNRKKRTTINNKGNGARGLKRFKFP